MSKTVACKVCGLVSPLGTAECPDCGAPLPVQPDPAPADQPDGAELPAGEQTEAKTKAKAPASPRKRLLRRAAVFLAVCLGLELAAFALPEKQPPPGMIWFYETVVTPQGVWNYGEEDLSVSAISNDFRYALFHNAEPDWFIYGSSSGMSSVRSSFSYARTPKGGYYLFDGRVLETLDWNTASAIQNGAVFYTHPDGGGTALCRRELATGKITRIDRAEGEAELEIFQASIDGTAVAYRWAAEEEDQEPGPYRLWRMGDKAPTLIDCGDTLWSVGKGGGALLFHRYLDDDEYYIGENILWQNGQWLPLPKLAWMWENDDLTEFILRDYDDGEYEMEEWYYYAPGETAEPVKLDVPDYRWLTLLTNRANGQGARLKGSYVRLIRYDDSGMDDLYYLGEDLSLTPVALGVEQLTVDEAGEKLAYLQNGNLYQIALSPGGLAEPQRLTDTADLLSSVAGAGTVEGFAASEDLEHIYYWETTLTPFDYDLYYWNDGAPQGLSFPFGTRGTTPQLTLTDEGCYIVYNRDLYYAPHGEDPRLVEEELGSSPYIQLLGSEKTPILMGSRWEDGVSVEVFWRLDGAKEPVELEEWYPKEGKI